MGSEVIAKCKCGVDTRILIGGGMVNFMTTCFFPCLCEYCHSVVQINLLAKRKQCPRCRTTKLIPYDDPLLSEIPGKNVVTDWNVQEQLGRVLLLTDGKYRCPQCGQMTLSFVETDMCWD